MLDDKVKCRDSIQKLMRIIIAQGNTISTQLAGLREKEEAIDSFEQKMHHLRMKESGRDYLLQTYLDQLPGSSDQKLEITSRQRASKESHRGSPTQHPGGVRPQEVKHWTEALDKLNRLNGDLTQKVSKLISIKKCHKTSDILSHQEEEILKLNQRTRSMSERQKSNKVVVPELEEILR